MKKNNTIPAGTSQEFTITAEDAGMRIDAFISKQFPNYSRSFFQKLFKKKTITVQNKPIKPGYKTKFGEQVNISFPTEEVTTETPFPDSITIDIIAKEDDFLIINKPAGLTVHKPKPTYTHPTLCDWLTQNYTEIAHVGAIDRPGIVHRLDKDTSGIMIIPRTNKAHELFSDMFKNRKIKKTYLALVDGHPDEHGEISFAIGRHPVLRSTMTHFTRIPENQSARDACTNYKVINYYDTFSLVEVKPTTGRTHQIRVHFKAIGHSLLGDSTYGKESKIIKHHALHASELQFSFEGKSYHFTCPLADAMQKIVAQHKPLVIDES